MKVILHDLQDSEFRALFPSLAKGTAVISQGSEPPRPCVGCFGCWIKSPGECVLHDGYGSYGGLIGRCTDYIVISRIVYGGYSPFIKNILDRNIGYLLPYFAIRNGEMHHAARYPTRIRFTVCGYGEDATPQEQQTFRDLAQANGLNLNAHSTQAYLVKNAEGLPQIKAVTA